MIGAALPGHAAPTAQTSTVMRQLDALTGRRARLTAAVVTRQAQVDAFAAAVLAGELRIKRDRAAQARVRSRLAALLVAQYKGPSSDPAAFLLGAGSLAELTSRADTLDRISASQAAVIAQLTADARKADAEEARTTALRRKVSTRLTALTATRAQIDQDITARRQLLAQLTAATLAAVHHEQHRRATLETETGGANDTADSGGQAQGQSFTGEVTWYGPGFAGQPTASGEIFDPSALTAASPWLAFGTMVQVTSTVTHRSVTVRVNDRGPFGRGVLDLSQHAAAVIGLSGWQVCRIQVVG